MGSSAEVKSVVAGYLRQRDGKLQIAEVAIDLKRTVEAMGPVFSGAMALCSGLTVFMRA